ncbi:DUF1972 domain-containing protein [Photobacterium damselae]|uniref:Glycosyltransferase family 1 protein n=1 Tax=Photobacterium damselae subsp. damselae TaxID=85581 RepID=A0AAD3ZWP8_PHODD|nr:DUF1972 domain-containing protein [Photobacterium damselae]KAB1183221.1 glycosyltransferase family 1 protein [Photobacterium damselae subsp. damselae]
MKKVSIVGTVGLPACYGGFESLVDNLTKEKSSTIDYSVYCSSKSYEVQYEKINDAKLIYIPLKANGVTSIFYDIYSLIHCLFKKPDVTLILGVSGCIFLPIFRLFSNSKIVTNIDGLEWKRDKWGKYSKKFLKLSERLAIRYSDVIIADNKAIADYVAYEYSVDAKVIAYGGDHVLPKNKDVNVNIGNEDDYYLALCRIEPENNVSLILDAFSKSSERIRFIGNWNNSQFGKNLKEQYSSYQNINIVDPIYDIDILYSYRSGCKGYIHGHSAGGTNPSLVEAMHIGKPILAFDCSFNRYSTNNLANYFTDADSLLYCLENISEAELKNNSEAMLYIANKQYRWDVITKLYEDCY